MNKNMKIAKELIKIAKTVISGEFDDTINAGLFDDSIKAGLFDKGENIEERIEDFVYNHIDKFIKNVQENKIIADEKIYGFGSSDGWMWDISFNRSCKSGYRSITIFLETKFTKGGKEVFSDKSRLVINDADKDDIEKNTKLFCDWIKQNKQKMVQVIVEAVVDSFERD